MPFKKTKDEKDEADFVATEAAQQDGEVALQNGVFDTSGESGRVQYTSVGWIRTAFIMLKTQLGIGILAIPFSFQTLGLVPGVLVLLACAGVTSWSAFYLGIFKQRYRHVYSLADVGQQLFGPVGREVFSFSWWLYGIISIASPIITVSTALNAVSMHATCTAIFTLTAAVILLPLGSLRTLGKLSYFGPVAILLVLTASFMVMIAVAVGDRPALAPKTGPFTIEVVYWGSPSFVGALNAVSSILFGMCGTPAYLPIASEMQDVRNYWKSVALCQSILTSTYVLVGVVVYHSAGQYVASPALGTAGSLIKKIAYGISIPGIVYGGIVYLNLTSKELFVRLLRNSPHLTSPTRTHWVVWLSCTTSCLLIGYILASAIPFFSEFISLTGALFAPLLAVIVEACMYLWVAYVDIRKEGIRPTVLRVLAIIFHILGLGLGLFQMVAGTYAAVIAVRDAYATTNTGPWTCADNSNSV